MNRKHFLSVAGTLLGGVASPWNAWATPMKKTVAAPYKIPPYLKKGDLIGITSPAGFITHAEIQPAVQVLQSWGYRVKIGMTIGKRDFTFGGTDEERIADLQLMLDDAAVKAILCARGGYGSIRIVDKINWARFKTKPKWLIGFSDITVLHSHIHTQCKVASLHSKMTNSFPDDWARAEPIQIQTILSMQDALSGVNMKYAAPVHSQNKLGEGEGILIGGNLKTIETLAGSASDISTAGKILFVEDTGEYLYSIDRMFWNLKRTGKLKALKGLIVGGFKAKPDDEGEEFGKSLQQIVLEKVQEYKYPVCFEFPVGHQRANYALKCGVAHRLTITAEDAILTEII